MGGVGISTVMELSCDGGRGSDVKDSAHYYFGMRWDVFRVRTSLILKHFGSLTNSESVGTAFQVQFELAFTRDSVPIPNPVGSWDKL